MKKAALIGTGYWGRQLASAFSKYVTITHIVSNGNVRNTKSIKKILPDCKISSLEDVLSDKSIVVVIVATPIPTLFSIARMCLLKNKNVFLEKPGAESSDQLLDLKKLINDKNNCYVNYQYSSHKKINQIRSKAFRSKTLNFKWEKWGTFDNCILRNLLSHELAILDNLIPDFDNQHIKEKIVNEDYLRIMTQSQEDKKIIIEIDRKKDHKIKKIFSENKVLLCDFYEHNQEIYLKNQCNFFLNNLKYSNIDTAIKVLKFIEKLEGSSL